MSTVYIFNKSWYDKPYCRCSSSVEHQLPKLRRRVRFPSSALIFLDAEACQIKASAISFNNPQGVHWGTPLELVENLVDFHCRNKSESGRTLIMICCTSPSMRKPAF